MSIRASIKQAIRGFMTEMRDLAHRLDGSRLTSFRRCDFARDIPDVYSPSIWAGWYSGKYHEYEQSLVTERERVKRFIHIEWGADSQAGRHSEDPETRAAQGDTTGNRHRGARTGLSQERWRRSCLAGWRLVGNLRVRPLRLAPEDAGEAGLAHGIGAVDLQGLRVAAAGRQCDPA